MKPIIIAVDFDGTIVGSIYPGIGHDLGGLFWLQALKELGCELFLWTCRAGVPLQEAKDWLSLFCSSAPQTSAPPAPCQGLCTGT